MALFAVMYRPPDRYDFFDKIYDPLEKAWSKSSNIFILGDFNCNFAQNVNTESGLEACGNTKKLLNIFQMFDLNNVINEMTRITLTSKSLIDLIVTTRTDMVQSSGVFTLGISDHNLVYATLRLKFKRPPPVIIRCRNFKLMNDTNFKRDVSRAPFHIGEIFDDRNDKRWTWEKLFKEICDIHAPWKEVKIRSKSLPWMNNTIRLKINRRFKLFKKAIKTKCTEDWNNYKNSRNQITSELRKAKADYFSNMFGEVTTSKAYWDLIKKSVPPKVRQNIGRIKGDNRQI